MTTFAKGQRVKTTEGYGTVMYQRMAPPTFSDAAAVSVKLDKREHETGYSGTIFDADLVDIATTEECTDCGQLIAQKGQCSSCRYNRDLAENAK